MSRRLRLRHTFLDMDLDIFFERKLCHVDNLCLRHILGDSLCTDRPDVRASKNKLHSGIEHCIRMDSDRKDRHVELLKPTRIDKKVPHVLSVLVGAYVALVESDCIW